MSAKRNSGKGRPTPTQRRQRHRSRSLDEEHFFHAINRRDGLVRAIVWLIQDDDTAARQARIDALNVLVSTALRHLYGLDTPLLSDAGLALNPGHTFDLSGLEPTTLADVLDESHPPLDYFDNDGQVNKRSAFPNHVDKYTEVAMTGMFARHMESFLLSQEADYQDTKYSDTDRADLAAEMDYWRTQAEAFDAVDWAHDDLNEYRKAETVRSAKVARQHRNDPRRDRSGDVPQERP